MTESCHDVGAAAVPGRPQIAIAGNPNVGTTTLFNALTGLSAKVSNYPGITVERRAGAIALPVGPADLVDLPGTYSLNARSAEEQITLDALAGLHGERAPDAVLVCPATATTISRIARGDCSDVVSATAIAARAPVLFAVATLPALVVAIVRPAGATAVFAFAFYLNLPVLVAPAMNPRMWSHGATQANVAALRALAAVYEETGFRRKAAEVLERALPAAADDDARSAIRKDLLRLIA